MFENKTVNFDELPKIEEVKFKSIHQNYLKVILLNLVLTFLFFLTVIILFFYFNEKVSEYINAIYVYIGYALFFLFLLIYLYIGFSRRKFAVRQKDISYRKGVLIKSIITVPYNRIQHIEIDEGLFSRMFNLASINIFTAGAQGQDLSVKGLNKEKAIEIKEYITNVING